jgi:hypothetical protein
MRLTLGKALMLALFASLLPGCDRTATDGEEAASAGQTSEGSADERNTPTRPPGGGY